MEMKRPSMAKAIKDHCRECMSDYADGRRDCEIDNCEFYYWMPFTVANVAKRAMKREQSQINKDNGLIWDIKTKKHIIKED